MKVIVLAMLGVLSIGSASAAPQDVMPSYDADQGKVASLDSFIVKHKKAREDADAEWLLIYNARSLSDATFAGKTLDNYLMYKLDDLPSNIDSYELDDGKQQCATNLGDLTLVLVEHKVNQDGQTMDREYVYIKDSNQWWVTENNDMRVVLTSYRAAWFEVIKTPEIYANLVNNSCYKRLSL